MTKLLLVVIPAFLVVAIAILSVQNANPISLKFFTFRFVALPFGLWLGLGLATGMVGAALLLNVFAGKQRQ